MNVLVIAAHLDDEVLGVGGTIARHVAAGDDVVVLNLCDRSTIHQRDVRMVELLRAQSEEVKRLLGIAKYIYAGLRDEYLPDSLVKAIEPIEMAIASTSPDVIYTHHQHDVNQDHMAVFHATLVATRAFSCKAHSIYSYEVLSSSEQAPAGMQFEPNHFVWIEPWLNKKIEAMRCYEQEMRAFPFPRSEVGMVALAQYRGMAAGLKCAEAFKTIRTVVK